MLKRMLKAFAFSFTILNIVQQQRPPLLLRRSDLYHADFSFVCM